MRKVHLCRTRKVVGIGVLLHRVYAALAAGSLLGILLAASLVVPLSAHATYADVADSYGTVEELTPKTDAIYADEIPDGTYRDVTVRTSSSFCKVTNCTLKKEDGMLVAAFTLTTTYTAIYMGTAEEAAAATDAAGDDDSAYTLAKEVTIGGTKLHQFTIALPAVSDPFYLATFNGGSKSHEKACWYDRSFIFDASDSIIMAVQSGTAPSEDEDEDGNGGSEESGDKDDGKDSGKSDEKSDSEKDSKDAKSDKDDEKAPAPAATKTDDSKPSQDTKAKEKTDSKKKAEADKDKKPAAAASSASSKSSGGSGGSSSGSSDTAKDKDAGGAGSNDQTSTQRATIPGVPLSFVSADLVPDELDAGAADTEKNTASTWGIDPMLLLAFAIFCALALVGAGMHVLLFKRAGGTLGRI